MRNDFTKLGFTIFTAALEMRRSGDIQKDVKGGNTVNVGDYEPKK